MPGGCAARLRTGLPGCRRLRMRVVPLRCEGAIVENSLVKEGTGTQKMEVDGFVIVIVWSSRKRVLVDVRAVRV